MEQVCSSYFQDEVETEIGIFNELLISKGNDYKCFSCAFSFASEEEYGIERHQGKAAG